jgi:hypothetical protein
VITQVLNFLKLNFHVFHRSLTEYELQSLPANNMIVIILCLHVGQNFMTHWNYCYYSLSQCARIIDSIKRLDVA